ncbi:MAG: hypothetical protein AAF525_07210 [Pseudomonadota bacterium]
MNQDAIIDAMKSVPDESVPPVVWDRVTSALARREATTRGSHVVGLAMAATLAAFTIGIVFFVIGKSNIETTTTAQARPITEPAQGEHVDWLVRSQQLERVMRDAPRLVVVETPTQRVLTNRIAAIDGMMVDALAQTSKQPQRQSTNLQQDLLARRAALLESYWRLQEERDTRAFRQVAY